MKMSKKTKKIIASAAIAFLSTTAFADTHETLNKALKTPLGNISFGAWGRSTFEFGNEKTSTKIDVDGGAMDSTYRYLAASGASAELAQLYGMETDSSSSKNFAQLNPDWSYGSRVGFWIIGRTDDEKFGFDFNLDSDARALFVHKLYDAGEDADDINYNEDGKYAVAIGDQAKMWAILDAENLGLSNKIAFGKMREQVLRGSIGDFGQRESSDVKSEDDIFSEFWPTTGLFVSSSGMEGSLLEGFYTAACIDLSGTLGTSAADTDRTEDVSLYDAMRTLQAGIGYTIPGIAQIKAQYWGDSISASNYKYEESKYKAARTAGYDMNDYYGRMEFGIDFLGFMGGATGLSDVDLEKTPNANLIEFGFKLPIVTREELREYDPETFYDWYACLGTMGVIQKGFILYKGHVWGGQGTSNLSQYTDVTGSGTGIVTLEKGKGADIFMAGVDFLTEVCVNPFGKQNLFVGLSGNYNITSASGEDSTYSNLELRQHNIGAELYVKKTFGANNYLFAGIADRFSLSTMDGTLTSSAIDIYYKGTSNKIYIPIGIEMFF